MILLTLSAFTVVATVRAQSSTAPDFTLPVVGSNGLTGGYVSLSSFLGKSVFLDFMEPWCNHCQNMAPVLVELHAKYGSGNTVFISIGGPWIGPTAYNAPATANDIAQFIRNYNESWIYLYDSTGSVFDQYGVNAVPDFFFIDPRGQIVVNYVGEQPYGLLAATLATGLPAYTWSFTAAPDDAAAIVDFTIDGQTIGSGMQFFGGQGTQHTVSVPKILAGSEQGTRYVFIGWSDGLTDASRMITVTGNAAYTAQYKLQYQLIVNSDQGNATGAGWYDEGSIAYASLESGRVSDGVVYNWDFAGWTNDASGMNIKSNPIMMNGPKTATAKWNHDFSIGFYGIIVTLIAVAAVVGAMIVRRGRTPEAPQASDKATYFQASRSSPTNLVSPRRAA